jgi:hypothetical protein
MGAGQSSRVVNFTVASGAQIVPGLTITQPANQPVITLTKSGTGSGNALAVNNSGAGNTCVLTTSGSSVNHILSIASNTVLGAGQSMVKLDHSGAAQTTGDSFLEIEGSGAAHTIPFISINSASATCTSTGIKFTMAGTGPDISLAGRATGSYADAAEGSIIYDTTLHKLRVRGAAAWETITSV